MELSVNPSGSSKLQTMSDKPAWHLTGDNPRKWSLGIPHQGAIKLVLAEVTRTKNGSWDWYAYGGQHWFGNEPNRLLAEIEATKIVLGYKPVPEE